MTSPIATALTGLLGGYNAGMEQRRARERQAMLDKRQADLDAQNRSDKDRDFRLRYSEGSLKRAVDTMNAGLIPDNDQLDTADFTGVKPQPGLDAMSGLPDTSQLFQAVSNMRAAPRIGIADESGQTTQYRQGEPVWQKKIRTQQEEERNRILATDAAKEAQRATAAAAQKDAANQALYGTLRSEFGKHPLSAQPYDKAVDYGAVLAHQRQLQGIQAGQSKQNWVSAGIDPKSGNPLILNTMTGETRIGGGVKNSAANTRAQAAYQAKLAETATAERTLKNAVDAVTANPDAFGLKNKLPSAVRQRLPWRDNATDAGSIGALENVVGELRHGRFGGALSALEAEKAARIFSEPSSPPDVILAQLTQIGKAIQMRREALGEAYGQQAGNDQPAGAPPGAKTITVNGKTFVVPGHP